MKFSIDFEMGDEVLDRMVSIMEKKEALENLNAKDRFTLELMFKEFKEATEKLIKSSDELNMVQFEGLLNKIKDNKEGLQNTAKDLQRLQKKNKSFVETETARS